MSSNQQDEKKHITLRIDESILSGLHQLADKESIHLSTLINKISRKYVNWYSHIPQNGNIIIWKLFPTLLMEKYSVDEIVNLSRKVAQESVRDTVLMTKGKLTRETILEVLQEWLRVNFKLEILHKDQSYKYFISHGMGEKWSTYIAITSQTALELIGVKNFPYQITDDTVSLSFDG